MALYLDYNATTPVDSDVRDEISLVLSEAWGNPSSSYKLGKKAKNVVEKSRKDIALMVGATSEEIIFTSGGTESNNMVIYSMLQHFKQELHSSSIISVENIPHIITTNIEHDSVKLLLENLEKEGKAHVTYVPVSKVTGIVDAKDIINELRPSTRLITVILANNETGMIQPVSVIKTYLDSHKKCSKGNVFLHTDAAQAIGKIRVDIQDLNVDYLTIVGHKFYGPRIGALYVRNSCPLYPLFYGGGQENNLRPGTENTCMVAGLGKASQLVYTNLGKYKDHMLSLKKYFEKELKREFSDNIVFNFKSDDNQLPNTLSVAFNYKGITGKTLLETSGICASTGAACHSGRKPSAVLIASGVPENLASKTLRISVGRETTFDDIDSAVEILSIAVSELTKDTSFTT